MQIITLHNYSEMKVLTLISQEMYFLHYVKLD